MKQKHLYAMVCVLGLSMSPANAFNFDLGKLLEIGKNIGQATKEFNEAEEIEIGSGGAATLLGAAPLVRDTEVQRHVNKVGRWLALQTGRPDLPWKFGVIDHPNINAFAAPGGYVFITKGLLAKLRNEHELAGVLAHEIAHVLQKHHLRAIQKNAQTAALFDTISVAASSKDSRKGELFNKLSPVMKDLYARGLDKDDELEADRMGVVIAARAGYDPYGLAAVLQTLQSMKPDDATASFMFKTHPPASERLEKLEPILTEKLDRYARVASNTKP